MTTTRLPLFPLSTVVFPGLVLPLNVFEARYRAMMRDLLRLPEESPRPFGVVAIRDGHEVAPTATGLPSLGPPPEAGPGTGFAAEPMDSFYEVGCVADAATIRPRPVPGTGEVYEVLATGTARFRLVAVDATGPYLTAEIEPLPESTSRGAEILAAGVLGAFRTYQRAVAGASARALAEAQELPEDPTVVSYLVAAATQLYTADKQRLLQAGDTATRLAEELRLLRRETTLIGRIPSLPGADFTARPTSLN